MRSNSSLKLNNVQVEEQKKSLAPHGSTTKFSGSKKNGVMQLKSEKHCESVCYKERPETRWKNKIPRRKAKQICKRRMESLGKYVI